MARLAIDHGMLRDENLLVIQNDRVRLGVNLAVGGAVTYLAELGRPNLINSFDLGRQVQMSFYSYPVPFHPEGKDMDESWRTIGWNPIQVGDAYGHRSQILESRCEDNEIYVKCIPMHWPLDNMPAECTFETWYRLDGNKVLVTARINNARPDTTKYPARGQELPAVYTCGVWYKLVSYIGSHPFTGEPVTVIQDKDTPEPFPGPCFCPTEHWAALVDDNGYGLGVYNGMTDRFLGCFAGKMGEGGPKDAPTGYISPTMNEILDHNIVYTYQYALIPGTVGEVREAAAQLAPANARSAWSFEKDRDHFTYTNITDAGWPTGGCLEFDFDAGSELVAPPTFFAAGTARAVELDAAVTGGEVPVQTVLSLYDGTVHERGHEYEKVAFPAVLNGDGVRRVHVLPLDGLQQPFEDFWISFGGSGHAKVYGVKIR